MKLLSIAAAAIFCGIGLSAVDFFAPAEDSGASLPQEKVFPAGRIFPITGYSAPSAKLLKTLGFSAAGPVYGGPEAMKKWAKEAIGENLPLVWQLDVIYNGKQITLKDLEAMSKQKQLLDIEQLKSSVRKSVEEAIAISNDQILWWTINPEELRHWRKIEMSFLQTVAEEIRNADPKKRPVSMYIPGHYTYGSLCHYTPMLDIIEQGFYPHAGASNRIWQRMWAENLIKATSEANRMAVAVTEMYVQPKEEEMSMIPTWVHHDVWLSLIYGCKGIIIFSFAERNNFDAHGYYIFAYADVAKELNGKAKLGEVLLFGKNEKELTFTVIEGEATAIYNNPHKKGEVHTYPTIAWRDIRHARGRYCFAVASSPMPVKVKLTGLPKTPVTILDAVNDTVLGTATDGTFTLDFPAWGTRLLRFAPATK